MRLLVAMLAFLIAFSHLAAGKNPQAAPETAQVKRDQRTVGASEQKWLQALFGLDLSTLESDEANDFTLITPTMNFTRETHLSSLRAQTSGARPSSPIGFRITNQSVYVYGNVAVLIDILTIQDNSSAGVSGGRYWQTEVWKKEKSDWKIVHMHISMMKHGM